MSNSSAGSSDEISRNIEFDIRILLLGRTGEGKSALGNLILGQKIFKTGAGGGSVTRECESWSVEFNNRKLKVIDTPGLFDTKLSNEEISTELTHSYYETAPGPHAFLIVTTGRHTTEAEKTLILLVQLFGQSVVDYCIVVITHEDDWIFHNTTKEEYLGDQTSQLRCFVNRCGGRCIAVNSRTKDNDERARKLTELVGCIDTICSRQQTSYYSHELFEKAAQDETERRENEEQRVRQELGETEIRLEENTNLQQREEEIRRKRDQQQQRLEVQRTDRNIQRDDRTSRNNIGRVFGALFAVTLKACIFVVAINNIDDNRDFIGYQHFRGVHIQRQVSFTRNIFND